jgi:hypothetical protein
MQLQVVDEEDRQTWHILKKQSRVNAKIWPQDLELNVGLSVPHR